MARIPPSLVYLTIYNPSLRPLVYNPDDEDAEEQAQILFYTSRERVSTRDSMLRQVGLAKALVSFSEMFSASDTCNNVHSQTMRMVMLEPEPGFWIHACLELAKTKRVPVTDDSKSRKRQKNNLDPVPDPVQYDYHDSSLNDEVLRRRFLRGYEQFKLKHGSFTTILHDPDLGQEALVAQMDRFFTVWALSQSFDAEDQFGDYIGLPLHPSHTRIRFILEDTSDEVIIISRSGYVPSPAFLGARHSHALALYLSSFIPPLQTASQTLESSRVTMKPPEPERKSLQVSNSGTKEGTTKFLGLPTLPGVPGLNMGVMDVRKWGWSGMFGKQAASKSAPQEGQKGEKEAEDVTKPDAASSEATLTQPEPLSDIQVTSTGHDSSLQPEIDVHIDTASLAEAIESDTMHTYSPSLIPLPPSEQPTPEFTLSGLPPDINTLMSDATADPPSEPLIEDQPPPPFSYTSVHLSSSREELIHTTKRRIAYIIAHDLMFVFVLPLGIEDLPPERSRDADTLLRVIRRVINEGADSKPETPLPTATRILQPRDKHVIVQSDGFTVTTSEGFDSRSEQLWDAHALFRSVDANEVFMRGQNPQHWHAARRADGEALLNIGEEVYLEVARKEANLTDVDNVLNTVIRSANQSV